MLHKQILSLTIMYRIQPELLRLIMLSIKQPAYINYVNHINWLP